MVACARPGLDTLVLLPMHQPCVAKVCCCSTNRPVPTEGRGGSADGRISDRDSLFTREAQAVPCHRANECRLIGILPGIDNRVHRFARNLFGRAYPVATTESHQETRSLQQDTQGLQEAQGVKKSQGSQGQLTTVNARGQQSSRGQKKLKRSNSPGSSGKRDEQSAALSLAVVEGQDRCKNMRAENIRASADQG